MVRDAITNLFASGSGGGGGGGGGPGGGGAGEVGIIGGGQYWSVFLDRLGATATEIGLIRSVESLVNVMLATPFGWLVDRTRKKKRTYVLGKALSLPASLMRYLARTWPFCIFIGVWETIALRLMSPPAQIILVDSLSNEDRVTGLSINQTVMSIAGLFGPIICASIISYFGGLGSADNIRPLFLLQFIVSLATMILVYTQMREVDFPIVGQKSSFISHLLSIFKVPLVKLLLLRQCAMTFAMSTAQPFITLYMVDVKGADEFILAARSTAMTALYVLLSIPIGGLAERIGRFKVSYLGRIFGWAGILLTVLTPPTHPELLVLAGMLEGLRPLMFIGFTAFEQELIPLENRGRYLGISMTVIGMTGIFSPILGGVIWDLNPDYIWWIRLFCEAFIVFPLMVIIGHKASKTRSLN